MPRVGNQAFANYIDANWGVTHVNNMEDPVPTVPGKIPSISLKKVGWRLTRRFTQECSWATIIHLARFTSWITVSGCLAPDKITLARNASSATFPTLQMGTSATTTAHMTALQWDAKRVTTSVFQDRYMYVCRPIDSPISKRERYIAREHNYRREV